MIVIRVWGGIGNQLFQYVFGEYLHYKYGQIVKYDDGSFYGVDTLRKRELDMLNAKIEYDSSYSFSRCRGVKNRILRTIFQLHPKHHLIIEGRTTLPTSYHKNHIYYFQGYWQSIEYYEWLKKHVPNFALEAKYVPQELKGLKNMMDSCVQSLSVHVRRGDYFSKKNIGVYGVCTETYDHKALTSILGNNSEIKVFVFTDDIGWVIKNLVLPNDVVIVQNYEIPQFAYVELMSHCKHHIISNSSFSWWGAVLNSQKGAIVISPDKWTLTSSHTISLNKWIKMSC